MNSSRSGAFSFPSFFAAAILLCVTVVSVNLFLREHDQFMRGILNDTDGFTHWSAPDHADVITVNAQIELLTGCIFALESWKTTFQARDAVLTVAQNCVDEADRILAFNAELSEAHYLKAYQGYLQGDEALAKAELGQAQLAAPTDQWLAVRRVNLSQRMWPGEPIVGDYDLKSDLGLLIASNRGLDTATRLYIKHESLRDMIVEATEPLDDNDRVRFLNRLKRAVRRL